MLLLLLASSTIGQNARQVDQNSYKNLWRNEKKKKKIQNIHIFLVWPFIITLFSKSSNRHEDRQMQLIRDRKDCVSIFTEGQIYICIMYKYNMRTLTLSYRALSFSAICSYFCFTCGSASAHLRPNSFAISPTP